MTPEICPSCGAEVPPRAKSCPECGADEHTGWSEEAYASNLGLPDDSFDYEEFVGREFGGKKDPPSRPFGAVWMVVAIVLVVVFLLIFF